MPRKARQKNDGAIYHVMCRSISEIDLFQETTDKNHYLSLLKRYMDKFKCKLYAFCLMDNHLHMHLDTQGFDVSKFMQSVNTAYVRYFNKKHARHGPLFQGRFESRILDSDRYNLAVSAYIHNNPKDISGYKGREEAYPYSSYGIYLGLHKDLFGLIDKQFVKGLLNTATDSSDFTKKYFYFVSNQRDMEDIKEIVEQISTMTENEYSSGRQIILRDMSSSSIVSFVSNRMMVSNKHGLGLKGNRKVIEYRSICAYILRVLGGLSYRQICESLHNMTISGCSRLCDKGYELISGGDVAYSSIFDELLNSAAQAA